MPTKIVQWYKSTPKVKNSSVSKSKKQDGISGNGGHVNKHMKGIPSFDAEAIPLNSDNNILICKYCEQ